MPKCHPLDACAYTNTISSTNTAVFFRLKWPANWDALGVDHYEEAMDRTDTCWLCATPPGGRLLQWAVSSDIPEPEAKSRDLPGGVQNHTGAKAKVALQGAETPPQV